MFFVLSGFILTYSYMDEGGLMKGSNRSFWVARFARIYPVYVLGFILYSPYAYEAVFQSGGAHSPQLKLGVFGVAAISLLQSWSTVSVGVWNPPAWSLSAEAFFYFAFPFVAPSIMKLSARRLALITLIFWILSIIAQLVFAGHSDINRTFWMFNPLVRLPEFLLGIVLGKCWKSGAFAKFENFSGYIAFSAALVIGAVLAVDADGIWLFNGATAPVMMVLIGSLAFGRGVLARLLASRPLVLLGESSYSLYILHWPLWRLFSGFLVEKMHLLDKGLTLFIVCEILSVAASIATFKLIEQPANSLIRKMWSPEKRAHDAATVTSQLAR
jgi:peptidoglycan/LPS O-acetylase OafA/YrhL